MMPLVKDVYAVTIQSEKELIELWEIDKQAYGDCSLAYEPFLKWWTRYPYGSRNLVFGGAIVASIGIYPLYQEQAEAFALGLIKESDLLPALLSDCETVGACHWYCSGIVIAEEFQNKGLLKTLLSLGIEAWEATGHIKFPMTLYGLAEYEIGEKLLRRFGFSKVKEGSKMPDGCDLYKAQITSHEHLERMREGSVCRKFSPILEAESRIL
jgi:GNAT superfamily N-acetyltransferase